MDSFGIILDLTAIYCIFETKMHCRKGEGAGSGSHSIPVSGSGSFINGAVQKCYH
jgi:hypothetical protein